VITKEQSQAGLRAYIKVVAEGEDCLKEDLACRKWTRKCNEFYQGCASCDGKYGRCEILQNLAKYFGFV
jgi:hypothetical protein